MRSKNTSIPLDEFINLSLYDKKIGYYMKKNPFGIKGDFITAPNISRLYSEMIAIWVINFWENLGSPKNLNLIELGAGNGEMIITDGTTLGDENQYFKPIGRIKFEYDVTNKL